LHAEQQRITSKVDEMMSLCAELEAQIETVEASDRLLLDALTG